MKIEAVSEVQHVFEYFIQLYRTGAFQYRTSFSCRDFFDRSQKLLKASNNLLLEWTHNQYKISGHATAFNVQMYVDRGGKTRGQVAGRQEPRAGPDKARLCIP